MLVFIDDSGDPGFNLLTGSGRIFLICCVIFDDELEAEKAAVAIKELKRRLKFPDTMEFKFNKSRKRVREEFLYTVNKFKFRARCLIIDKSIIKSEKLHHDKNSFYSFAIKLVLQHSNDTIFDASIRIDGSGDRIFRKNFLTYLRKQLNSNQKKVMKNCKLVNSKSNVLIQMTDMIAGSIKRAHEGGKTDSDIYRKIIQKHLEDEWKFQ